MLGSRTPTHTILITILLLTASLAGCVGGDEPVDEQQADVPDVPDGFPADWAQHALAGGSGHDHGNAAHHANLTTPNFDVLGYSPLAGDEATPRGNLCGDAKPTEDGRQLAAAESREDVAFTVADVTDPAAPEYLGRFIMRTTYVYDLAVVPDGEHVVLVTSNPKTPHDGSADARRDLGVSWESPCAPGGSVPLVGEPLYAWGSHPARVLLVSIADPASPQVVDQRPLAGLGHSVWSGNAADRTWVLSSTWAATSGSSTYDFYEVADAPQGGKMLHRLSTWSLAMDPGSETENQTRYMGHNDGVIQTHPVTGDTLAYLALWDHGMLVLNLNEPRTPELVGRWSDYDPATSDDESGNVHEAIPLSTTWDGRHYTFVGPELVSHPETTPSGVVRVLDTTDPGNPQEVAAWTLPHDVEWEERLQWSTHYIDVDEDTRTLFVSMYHGGVWAIDLTPVGDGNWTNLDSIGVFMPNRESPTPPSDPFRWTPTMEEVHVLDDGTLVTFDSNVGLYTLSFDADMPAPTPTPWDLPAPSER